MESAGHMELDEFLEKLASPDFPSPASGSAIAMVAAIAAAILEMSCKATIKKGGEDLPISLHTIEETRHQCLSLATKDMEKLAEVLRLTKCKEDSPGKYEVAMKNATDTFVSLIAKCEIILTQTERFIHRSSKKVYGELANSAYMAEAAAVSAKLGVESNLLLLQDEIYKENTRTIIRERCRNCVETRKRIIEIIES
ncbi:cyclodeaminase/cyclohydrolase family protein [Bacillus benzoevorans]|uniref:Formiminotetrahydrofolate cyclodeaminase n=1 Tax=Bacillus benzoevorans TaxID=1456 RepID=A0A7X0LXR3_9BACI|nr:cyclodeaminase/cyclohydrolase family protein [Bacillus benzoevorans]MBB6446757.1 formiminotetrahydrofolate cyclodeaminase [Bacillus benzoevorans]